MKNLKLFSLIILILLNNLFLTACNDDESDGSNYLIKASLNGNPQNLDPQLAYDTSSFTIIRNMFSGLLKMDENGIMQNDAAQSYSVSDDNLIYTFHLRTDCFWVDDDFEDGEEYPVTAEDFVFAFRRIFNPDTDSPYAEDFLCIKNAADIIAGNLDYTQIGVYAISDYQLEFHLDFADADFLNLLTSTSAMPCNEKFFLSTKGRYGLDKESVISNGSFYLTEWFYDPYGPENIIYMKRNSFNSEYDFVYPSGINFTILDSEDACVENFLSGSSDFLSVQDIPDKINDKDYSVSGIYDASVGLIFNFNDEIFSNANIRNAFAAGIGKAELMNDADYDSIKFASGLIPPAATLLNKSYRELVSEDAFQIESADAKSYLNSGLADLGLNSIGSVNVILKENMLTNEMMHSLIRQWQDNLGFYVSFEPLSDYEYEQALQTGEFQLAVYQASANYNSVFAIFETFAENAAAFGYSDENMAAMINAAHSKGNLSECINIFREVESKIIADCVFVPIFYKPSYAILQKNYEDISLMPFSGEVDFKHAKYFED